MLYSSRRYRGLGLVCARSEVQLQHFAKAQKLNVVVDQLFHSIYDCNAGMNDCKEALDLVEENVKQLRIAFRLREFEKWSTLSYGGIGVKHYKTFTKANSFISDKKNMSNGELMAAIKLSFGYANLAGVPGTPSQNNRCCRRCDGENETIQHVLEACHFGTNARISRHHEVKHKIEVMMREKGFDTVDEAYAIGGNGSNRFIDILAFEPNSDRAVKMSIINQINCECDATFGEFEI